MQILSGEWLLGTGPAARKLARLQTFGIDWLLRTLLPRQLRQMHDLLPPVPLWPPAVPEFLPAVGQRRARVALFLGCVNDALFPHVNWATAKVLQHNGCDVWTPRSQVCCGALHYHAGREAPAAEFAKQNCRVFLDSEPLDAIIMNVAGCGSMRHEIGHLLEPTAFAKQGRELAAKMRDVSAFLMELGPVPPTHPLNLRATYHDACHLCHAQQIRKQPRQLLEMIPGLQLVPLNESEICCGAAGSYNLTQPEMAERLGERKTKNLLATKPEAVFTANAGCLLQIGKHLRESAPEVRVAHPVEALWASYAGNSAWRERP
jgi:glycolate oxidase iron-sulfur subunit